MSWLTASLYDGFMKESEQACLAQWRADLLRELSGSVLEIGAGTGSTVSLYPAAVTRLVMAEPDPHMRRKLSRKARPGIEIAEAGAENLPYPAESFDAVVCSLVLCSVADQSAALAQIRRVLKPSGRLVFLEHVAARDKPDRLKWQKRLEPLWKRVMDNCHLTRDTEAALVAAGFTLESIKRESIRKAVPIVRPSIRGIARKTPN